jgi:hypothetical protein
MTKVAGMHLLTSPFLPFRLSVHFSVDLALRLSVCLCIIFRDSSNGILCSLITGRSEDRMPVGARFSSHVLTGPGAHQASYTLGTGFFQGVKRPGRGIDLPPSSSDEVKERVACYRVTCTFTLLWTLIMEYLIKIFRHFSDILYETTKTKSLYQ